MDVVIYFCLFRDRKATLSKCVKKVNKNVIKLMNQKIIK